MKTHVNEDCTMVRRACLYQVVGCKFEVSGLSALLCMYRIHPHMTEPHSLHTYRSYSV